MPRTNPHPFNRYAFFTPSELKMCNRVARAVVKASTSNSLPAQRKAIRESGQLCVQLANANRWEVGRGIRTMQISHHGRLKALKASLKLAGAKRLDASVHTILVVGYFLHSLPQFVGRPSIVQKWENDPDVSWMHWLELAPICLCDIAEYPLPYTLTLAKTRRPEDCIVEPIVDPHLHEVCCTRNEFLDAIFENYRLFDHCLTRIVQDSLTPRQVCLQRDQLNDELIDGLPQSVAPSSH